MEIFIMAKNACFQKGFWEWKQSNYEWIFFWYWPLTCPDTWGCVCTCVLRGVWLFATLWSVAHQAPLTMGFPRQEYWVLFPPPGGSSQPRDGTHVSPLHLLHWQTGYLLLSHLEGWHLMVMCLFHVKKDTSFTGPSVGHRVYTVLSRGNHRERILLRVLPSTDAWRLSLSHVPLQGVLLVPH